ncbi:PREDICTED: uncharacterized protein LOC109164862 [Ipomoea nil]|uniref:uncharacterized protein LOC109164862 n=1 Tax=Ipomoea nil TaxID=35883 RepID=UPI000900FAB6|nr:PREDICTED: uncharacterized protein LOC109164862 [Ipomoea nil]
MAEDSSDVERLTARWEGFDLEDERDEFVPEGEGVGELQDDDEETWAVVGRFLTTKLVKLDFMKQVMASVWQPVRGVQVTEIQQGLFLFVFYHRTDIDYVLDGGPWGFENNTLVCREVVAGTVPGDVELNSIDMWVQLHGLPMGYTSDTVLEQAGNFIGKFVKHDERFAGAPWLTFYRIRVSIAVGKPLRRGMKLVKRDKSVSWITFRYERLHKHCSFCGMLGHVHMFCLKARERPTPVEMHPFLGLRAGGNRGAPRAVGENWLVPVGGKPKPRVREEAGEGVEGGGAWGREEGEIREGSMGVGERVEGVVATVKRRRGVEGEGEDVAMTDVSKNLRKAGARVQSRPSS